MSSLKTIFIGFLLSPLLWLSDEEPLPLVEEFSELMLMEDPSCGIIEWKNYGSPNTC